MGASECKYTRSSYFYSHLATYSSCGKLLVRSLFLSSSTNRNQDQHHPIFSESHMSEWPSKNVNAINLWKTIIQTGVRWSKRTSVKSSQIYNKWREKKLKISKATTLKKSNTPEPTINYESIDQWQYYYQLKLQSLNITNSKSINTNNAIITYIYM